MTNKNNLNYGEKRKKYAFLINSLQIGGAERVVQTIVNSLCDQYEVHLITLEGNVIFKLDDRVIIHNMSNVGSKRSKLVKFMSLGLLALKLKKYLKINNIFVVQSNLFRANYVNVLAKILGGSHCVIITDHTLPRRLYKEGWAGKMNVQLIKLLYKYADVSICVSAKVLSQLSSMVDLPVKRCVINNPFNIKNIIYKAEERIDDFNFGEDKIYLVSVGRVNSVKRYDLIIKALNLIKNNNLCLIVIGKEEDVKVSDLLGVSDNKKNIYFLGEKDNPYKYIKNSDVLILSSDSESFGNVLVESMICGTPVISTRCGGPEEIIRNHYNGVLIDTGDVKQLADAINELVFDGDLMAAQVCNASLGVEAYEAHKIVEQYKNILEGCS